MDKPAPKEAPVPRRAGDFWLVRELGRGGMGVVYEARHMPTGRPVALKVLAPDLEYSDSAWERFRREARLAASISHPNCVFVLGAHDVEGSPAIAMELMTGETLADRLARTGPMSVEAAVACALQILDGLEAARRVGVVHRDIKPSNCFFARDGTLKIGDFGLARPLVHDTQLTIPGQFLGSPRYASPEQVRGEDADARSDVYSVGATLHHLLSGRPPFDGRGLGEILARILADDPPRLCGVPRALERVVRRAMAKDRERRFRDPASFREALRPWRPRAARAPSPWLRLAAFAIDLLGAVLASALVAQLVGQAVQLLLGQLPPGGVRGEVHAAAFCGYFALLAGLRGATPGMELLDLEVLAASTLRPNRWRAAARGALSGAWLVVGMGLVVWVGEETSAGPALALGVALLAAPFLLVRPGNGWRGLHELLTGTRVVQAERHERRGTEEELFDPPRAAGTGGPTAIGRYVVTACVAETPHGPILEGRDPRLDRAVWLWVWRPGSRPARRERPVAGGAPGLHWLDEVAADGSVSDVYERPGGASFLELAAAGRRLAWARARVVLLQLVEELQADPRVRVDELWIAGDGRLRRLDRPLSETAPHGASARAALAAATRLALGLAPGQPAACPGLPAHAEPVVDRLLCDDGPDTGLAALRERLAALAERPAAVTPGRRRSAFGASAVAWGAAALVLGMTVLGLPGLPEDAQVHSLVLLPGVAGILLAVALRGGLGLALAGLVVRTDAGPLAGRLRCGLRSALVWLPAHAALLGALGLQEATGDSVLADRILLGVALILAPITLLLSGLGARSLQDRIARTHLVLR